jgi:hypothetical protein
MTRYVTNTNTSTATATSTNTSTNTNTSTSTVTQTYGTDDNSDGVLQASELNADGSGSDFLFTDSTELAENNGLGTNANGYYDLVIENQRIDQQITLGAEEFYFADAEGNIVNGNGYPITYEVSIDQPVYAFDAFNDYAAEPISYSVDDGSELPSGIEVISVDADGWFTITQDITQNFNQDIVQDVFYESAIIQDFIQTQDINQTYTVDEIRTATATRLVSE